MQIQWNIEIWKVLKVPTRIYNRSKKRSTILWGFAILTDRKIKNNRPEIVVKEYKRKTILPTDVLVPTDNNVSLKEYNKIDKYKDVEIEIEKMWHLKTTIVPVIMGALGMIKKRID